MNNEVKVVRSKELTDKAIDIKGKKYVQVKDRVIYFNEVYTNGRIYTELVSDPSADRVVFKATIVPDVAQSTRVFTGYSQASWSDNSNQVNKSSAIENAETSAVGRALALMGIGVIDSIASVDEVNKANAVMATEKQLNYLKTLISNSGVLPDVWATKLGVEFDTLTAKEVSGHIQNLLNMKKTN